VAMWPSESVVTVVASESVVNSLRSRRNKIITINILRELYINNNNLYINKLLLRDSNIVKD